MSAAYVLAKLKWEAACERLRFALDRPKEAIGQAPEVAAAFERAHTALTVLQASFEAESDHDGRPVSGDQP